MRRCCQPLPARDEGALRHRVVPRVAAGVRGDPCAHLPPSPSRAWAECVSRTRIRYAGLSRGSRRLGAAPRRARAGRALAAGAGCRLAPRERFTTWMVPRPSTCCGAPLDRAPLPSARAARAARAANQRARSDMATIALDNQPRRPRVFAVALPGAAAPRLPSAARSAVRSRARAVQRRRGARDRRLRVTAAQRRAARWRRARPSPPSPADPWDRRRAPSRTPRARPSAGPTAPGRCPG